MTNARSLTKAAKPAFSKESLREGQRVFKAVNLHKYTLNITGQWSQFLPLGMLSLPWPFMQHMAMIWVHIRYLVARCLTLGTFILILCEVLFGSHITQMNNCTVLGEHTGWSLLRISSFVM